MTLRQNLKKKSYDEGETEGEMGYKISMSSHDSLVKLFSSMLTVKGR